MRTEKHMSDPVTEFEQQIAALRRSGMSMAEAARETERTEPELTRRYKRAMRVGHVGMMTVRPGDGPLTMR